NEVVASDGKNNLTGSRKLAELDKRFTSFDYAGDSRADLPIWRQARRGIVVSASARLIAQAEGSTTVERVFPVNEGGLATFVRAIRVHQWAKNVLLFVPALAAHCLLNGAVLASALLAFVGFSLCASGGYLLNDLLDLEADRRDPKKRHRPLAS